MNHGRQQRGETSASKDPCLQSGAARLEHWHLFGYAAAIGIAKLLGQDEVVAMLTEDLDQEGTLSRTLPATKA